MKILNPAGSPRPSAHAAMPTVASLAGRRLAILSNHWKSMDRIASRICALAGDRFAVSGVRTYDIPINGAMPDAVERAVLQECDVAIVGLAN